MPEPVDIAVQIPQHWLLILAGHGNMGDGEIPRIMQSWAQKECSKHGLDAELKQYQEDRIAELKQRLRNIRSES